MLRQWNQSIFFFKVTHRCSVVYRGVCTCGADYIGETKRCEHVRFEEHDSPAGTSEPSKHLQTENGRAEGGSDNIIHKFEWATITRASPFTTKRKILEGLYVAKSKPSLNEQVNCYKLRLFCNGIMWTFSAEHKIHYKRKSSVLIFVFVLLIFSM